MPFFCVDVHYQTGHRASTKRFSSIEANNHEQAITIAHNRVRRMRGVIKIDGGDAIQKTISYSVRCAMTGQMFPFGNLSNAVHFAEKNLMDYAVFEEGREMSKEAIQEVVSKVRKLLS